MSDFSGTIKIIGQTESVGYNGFTKRQLVVDSDEQYSQPISVDFIKDKCSILDSYKVGQKVKVYYNIRSNEYNGKYYTNLQAWRIEKIEGEQHQPTQAAKKEEPMDTLYGDLPF